MRDGPQHVLPRTIRCIGVPLACPAHVSKYVLKQPRGSFSGSGEKVHPPPPKLSCTEFVLTTYGQINCNLYTKKHRFRGAVSSYGRGSWTRTNACGIQRPVPYQLGDTPVSSASLLSTQNIIRKLYLLVNTFLTIFLQKVKKYYCCIICSNMLE